MADALRDKYEAEFGDSKESIIASIKNTISNTQGTIDGINKNLAELKLIANTDISEWENKYNEYNDKVTTNNAEITRLELERDEQKTVIDRQLAELENNYNVKSEIKIEIPEALTEWLYWDINNALYRLDPSADPDPNEYQMQLEAVKITTDIPYTYKLPTSLSLSMEPDIKELFIYYLTLSLDSYIYEDNELANKNRNLEILKINNEDAKKAYNDAIGDETKGWIKAKNDFIEAADAYKYQYKPFSSTNRYDARTILLKEIAAYEAIESPTTEDQTEIKNKIKEFLTQRKELDGFVCNLLGGDAITKIDETGGLDAYLQLGDTYYGSVDLQVGTDDLYRFDGSLYDTYMDATEAIWGSNISTLLEENYMLVPYTYEQWKNSLNYYGLFEYYEDLYLYSTSTESDYGAIIGYGLANDCFMSTYLYETEDLTITHQTDFRTLMAGLETISEGLLEANEAYQEARNLLIAQKYEIDANYTSQIATLTEEITGLSSLINTMRDVTIADEGNSSSSYQEAIAEIKEDIAAIEGVGGTLPAAQHTLNYYTKLLESAEKGEYEFAQTAVIAQKDALYNARKAESEALQSLFDAANEKKNQLLAAIAGV